MPDAILVRVIVEGGRLQFWIAIAKTARNLELGAELYDGATAVLPRPVDGPTDLNEVIAAADQAWHQQKQPCHSTSPTTGERA